MSDIFGNHNISRSTTKLHQHKENLGSGALDLTSSDLREINEAASRIKIQGNRYPEQLQKMTGR